MGHAEVVFTDIDRQFQSKELKNAADNFYSIYAHYNDKKKIHHILKELNMDTSWPATYLMLEGSYNILDSIIEQIKKDLPLVRIETLDPSNIQNAPNTVYIGDFKTNVENIYTSNSDKKSSMIVLGHHSETASGLLNKIKVPNLLLDDVNFKYGSHESNLQDLAVDTGPFTSFAYQAKYFLIKDE